LLDTVRTFEVRTRDDASLRNAAKTIGVALSVAELRSVADGLGRDPTIVELFAFDAQWSEHCSYKSSRAFLSRLPTTGDNVLVGVGQDAGIVRLGEWNGETYGIVIAHESHNHPSQVVPFEGAATGIGGIVRDVLCMGARLIALADPLRFGSYDDPHCRYVAQSVVDGIAAYGNAIGVPNIAGDVFFHPGFDDNCLVNVVALGVVKASEIIPSAAPAESEGYDIVLVGKATDRSGFGGAAFSSVVLDEADRDQNRSAVQVPDPFLKNVIMRASYRVFDAVRDAKVAVGFKDLGAGGIMGCTAEIVASGGMGARIDLDLAPTSQPNLPPEVIAIGETQERLTWVVPPSFTPTLLRIYNEEFTLPQIARGACAAVIGTVTREQRYVLTHHGDVVMDVPIDFLTSGVRYERPYTLPEPVTQQYEGFDYTGQTFEDADNLDRQYNADSGYEQTLERILAHGDVCSRAPIYERFDSVVRGATALPAGTGDAGVIVPVPGAPFTMAVAVGGNPRYAELDAAWAAERAVIKAVRSVVAVGTDPVALTDCLNFGSPEDPAAMGAFVASVDGLARAAEMYALPYVSGNVSLYNQSAGGSPVPPSAIVACIGVGSLETVASGTFKRADAPLYLLGGPFQTIAGSVLDSLYGPFPETHLQTIDRDGERAQIALVREAFRRGVIATARDISDGGLFTTLCKMSFGTLESTPIGIRLIVDGPISPPDSDAWWMTSPGWLEVAFEEFSGFVVEVCDEAGFLTLARELTFDDDATHGMPALRSITRIGETTGAAVFDVFPFTRDELGNEVYDLRRLHEIWSAPLRDLYQDATV